MIETGFIPIKITPTLSPEIVNGSIFNYLEDKMENELPSHSWPLVYHRQINKTKKLLKLSSTEPVGIIDGIFF